MKNRFLFSTLLIPFFLIFSIQTDTPHEDAQRCRVLLKSINKTYKGDCKKGFAHGQGVAKGEEDYYEGTFKKGIPYGKGKYVWGNGEFYVGDFKNGMRHGQGVMHTFNDSTGVIEKNKLSLWKEHKFMMEIMEENYKIIHQRNVVGVNVRKKDEERNRVEIQIRNSVELRDVVIVHDVGSLNKFRDDRFTIDYVEFPVKLMINYTSANKFNQNRIMSVIEMLIESPGDWMVDISH